MNTPYEELRDSSAVHVWQGLAAPEAASEDLLLLSDHELRVMAGRSPAAAGQYAGAHAAMRRILASYTGLPASGLRFGRQTCPRCEDPGHGRPVLTTAGPPLDFNLSRSGAHWLLAVSAGQRIGVDLEDGRDIDFSGSARLVLTPSELRHLDGQRTDPDRLAVFLRCWTRKEAVVKASGVGIVADLRTVEVRPETDHTVEVPDTEPGTAHAWTVEDLDLEGGPARMHGALARAADRPPGPVLVRSYARFAARPA